VNKTLVDVVQIKGNGNSERWQTDESLRDWFAGMALTVCPFNMHEVENNAKWAYEMADAMMRARK
jgi:hypothetical protein